MSQHVVLSEDRSRKWVFGWDQMLQSFFLQVHRLDAPEDEQIVAWLGADKDTEMYAINELVTAAAKHGLMIDHHMGVQLYRDKNDGR